MTADTPNYEEQVDPGNSPQILAIACAGLTLFFALISIITGNRLSTLQADHLEAVRAAATSETVSINEMKTALDTATTDLKNARKALGEEKAATEKLRKQLAKTQKQLQETKAGLAGTPRTIPPPGSATPGAPGSSATGQPSPEQVLPPSPLPPQGPQPSNAPSVNTPAPPSSALETESGNAAANLPPVQSPDSESE
jgi:hypothetical protein